MEANEVNQILETITNEYVIKGGFSNKFYAKMFAVSFAASTAAFLTGTVIVGYIAISNKKKEAEEVNDVRV